jgi:putative transposase
LLGRRAMNLMLINVLTRKLRRAVRLSDGDLPVISGDGISKSAASRRVRGAVLRAACRVDDLGSVRAVALGDPNRRPAYRPRDLVLIAALGIGGDGNKHPLGLVEGAIEANAA